MTLLLLTACGGGDDFITALGGTVTIDAGAGDDLALLSSVKEATVTLGSGTDTLVIEDSGIGATYRIRDFNLNEDIIYIFNEPSTESPDPFISVFDDGVSFPFANGGHIIFEGIGENQVGDLLSIIIEQFFADGDLTIGSLADDVIYGLERNDIISSFRGNDTINGLDGNDTISGHQGNDTINGGDGNDRLFGHEGNDIINGGAGSDLLFGMADNDELDGGSGNDHLYGGAGQDILIGGLGRDTPTGVKGRDIFLFEFVTETYESDIITDFEINSDVIYLGEGFTDDTPDYRFKRSDGDTAIYFSKSGAEHLIVTLQGITNILSYDDIIQNPISFSPASAASSDVL